MQVSDIAGVRPYLSTPEGLTGASGSVEGTGCGKEGGRGFGAGAPGADGGSGTVVLGIATGVDDLEE